MKMEMLYRCRCSASAHRLQNNFRAVMLIQEKICCCLTLHVKNDRVDYVSLCFGHHI